MSLYFSVLYYVSNILNPFNGLDNSFFGGISLLKREMPFSGFGWPMGILLRVADSKCLSRALIKIVLALVVILKPELKLGTICMHAQYLGVIYI